MLDGTEEEGENRAGRRSKIVVCGSHVPGKRSSRKPFGAGWGCPNRSHAPDIPYFQECGLAGMQHMKIEESHEGSDDPTVFISIKEGPIGMGGPW